MKLRHDPKYSLFFDNHTMQACPDVGAEFDAEEFVGRIADCGVDFVTFHARCNQGFAYYDTTIGTRHPSLKGDMFGQFVRACKERGIAVSAYFNVGISSEEALRHPDWATLYPDGRIYQEPFLRPDVRTMCYNSPYRNHLLEMIQEVATNYPVKGFFLDCLYSYRCVCPKCLALMQEQGLDWRNDGQLDRFSLNSAVTLAGDIARTIKTRIPSPLINFNGIGRTRDTERGTYVELECLPSNPAWGYGFLPVMARYLSNRFDDRPLLNMTGRFYDWGDFGGLRPRAGLEYDLFYGLAFGLRPNIGCHFHPRGTCNHAVFDRVKSVYDTIRKYEPWHEAARPEADIAILFPKTLEEIGAAPELRGCVGMLTELRHSFTLSAEEGVWENHRLVLLPDTVTLHEDLTQRLHDYIAKGGAVLSTGRSGLRFEGEQFALEQEWGLHYQGESVWDPAYFTPAPAFSQGLPDMPLALYEKGIAVTPHPETEVGAFITAPYYNKHWDGRHAYYYCPPDRQSNEPLLTINGRVGHITHPVFTAYHTQVASLELRQLVCNVLERLLPRPLLKVQQAPSFLKAFVTSREGQTIIHLLAYVPDLRGRVQIVEDAIAVTDCQVAIRLDGQPPKKVYLAPDGTPVSTLERNGYLHISVPPFKGYAMLVLEIL